MAKSVVDIAIEHIDAQIADLNRAKEILTMAAGNLAGGSEPLPKTRKPRGPNKRRGLPTTAAPQNETSADGF